MATNLEQQNSGNVVVLYMALELSNHGWKLCFSDGNKMRNKAIEAGDLEALEQEIDKSRARFRLATDCRVASVYEAGRDGFWIDRALQASGIENRVVDPASIEVNRKQRRVKTDRVDAEALVRQLIRYDHGEGKALAVVRMPTVAEEDQRRLHRERDRLIKERGAHSARIQSLLVAHGLRQQIGPGLVAALADMKSPAGYALGEDIQTEIRREYVRYDLVDGQIRALERTQRERLKAEEERLQQVVAPGEYGGSEALRQVVRLLKLRGVGQVTGWVLAMEFFSWRAFRNRRELGACAGLTPTPYASGDLQHDQGISKASNRRIRRLLVEVSWLWLRYQPESALSKWYQQRFANSGKRMRRIGIVALARKLLVALWQYVEEGVVPEGAVLSA
jgi:transposase